jgi:MFS family permease
LSCYVTTVTAVAAAITFSASGAAPTPLYHEYQEHFGLTPFMITIIFAAYVLSLLLALLTVGSLSDYVGRRPAILAALMANILAMVVFMTAGSAAALIVARTVQGFANGLAITTLAATILDTDKERAPLFNSVTAFAGLLAGKLPLQQASNLSRNSRSAAACLAAAAESRCCRGAAQRIVIDPDRRLTSF